MSWEDFSNKNRQKGQINNLRLESGRTYLIRFVSEPKCFYKYYVGGETGKPGRSAICADPATCPVRAKYNIEPSMRWVANVIDRADKSPTVRVMEMAPSVLAPVKAWMDARKIVPSGDGGCDFNIVVTGQKKSTRYAVTPMDITPLTTEEKKLIETTSMDLDKLYKPVPQNEIEAKLFSKEGSTQPQRGNTQTVGATAGAGGFDEQPPF